MTTEDTDHTEGATQERVSPIAATSTHERPRVIRLQIGIAAFIVCDGRADQRCREATRRVSHSRAVCETRISRVASRTPPNTSSVPTRISASSRPVKSDTQPGTGALNPAAGHEPADYEQKTVVAASDGEVMTRYGFHINTISGCPARRCNSRSC